MIKTLFSKVSGNVYDGDHVDHVEVEVEVEQNLLDHPKDQDRTDEEEVVVEVRSEDQEMGAIPLLKEEAEAHNDVYDQNLLKMKYRHHQSRSPYQLAPEKSGLN